MHPELQATGSSGNSREDFEENIGFISFSTSYYKTLFIFEAKFQMQKLVRHIRPDTSIPSVFLTFRYFGLKPQSSLF